MKSSAHYLGVLAHLGGLPIRGTCTALCSRKCVGCLMLSCLKPERDTQLLGLLYPGEGRIDILQWNLSIEDTPMQGHLCNKNSVAVPTTLSCVQIYLLTRDTSLYRTASWVPVVSSIERSHCIQDSQLGPSGVLYREVLLYTGQPAGSQWCPL